MSRIFRLTGVTLLAVLALAACGDDDGVGGAQQATAERADQICLDAQDKVGRELGDDAASDRDAIREATDRLMEINAPSENETTWTLFVQSMNNLWIALEDVAQARLPEVDDRARAEAALETVRLNHERVMRYAEQYGAEQCAEGFGRPRD